MAECPSIAHPDGDDAERDADLAALAPPTWEGVQAASRIVAKVLPVTPAWSYPLLSEHVGTEVILKHENCQPTGAFKVRGGVVLAATLSAGTTRLVTASTGNHAQSVAYAARQAGIAAIVVMPESAPQNKIAATQALGAEVVSFGPTMTEAVDYATSIASEPESLFVDPGGVSAIVHGHATSTLELLQAHPELQAIYVPIGSGTQAAGACLVRDAIAPGCRIIGVQSRQAPAAYRAWKERRPATAPCVTTASGLSTAASFPMTQSILTERLDDFLLVDDSEIDRARGLLASHAHTLAEGAGAAALAGVIAAGEASSPVGVIVSGGNADSRELATLA